jgi:hypothetical protein
MAVESGVVKRIRKLSASALATAFCCLAGCPVASFGSCAAFIQEVCGIRITRQALFQRMTPALVVFMKMLMGRVVSRLCRMEGGIAEAFPGFNRILVKDSTIVAVPAKLGALFTGSSNQHGKATPQVRIQACFDLLAESCVHLSMHSFTRNDQAASRDIMTVLRPRDLVLRDLGYFAVPALCDIAGAGAFFISRFRVGTAVYCPVSGTVIDVLATLRTRGAVDMPVLLGKSQRLPVRLVALPVPPEIAERRRRKAIMDRDRRHPPSKEKLALMAWEIFVANIPQPELTTEQIRSLYGLRWRIEIIFKTWKSGLNLTDFTGKAGPSQVQTLIIGRLVQGILMQKAWDEWNECLNTTTGKHLSLLKTATRILHSPALFMALLQPPSLHSALGEYLLTHCTYESRKRKNHAEILQAMQEELWQESQVSSFTVCYA